LQLLEQSPVVDVEAERLGGCVEIGAVYKHGDLRLGVGHIFLQSVHQRLRSACNARCQIECGETDRRQGPKNLVISCQSVDFRRQSARDGANGSQTGSFPEIAVAASRKVRFDSMPSASGGIARLVSTQLRKAGIPPKPLLVKAGLTMEQIDDRRARVTVQ